MPAVVRGGRRQGTASAPRRGAAPKRGGGQARGTNAPIVGGKFAAVGKLDLSPRAVVIAIVAGIVALATTRLVDGYAFIIVGSLSGALVGAFSDDAA